MRVSSALELALATDARLKGLRPAGLQADVQAAPHRKPRPRSDGARMLVKGKPATPSVSRNVASHVPPSFPPSSVIEALCETQIPRTGVSRDGLRMYHSANDSRAGAQARTTQLAIPAPVNTALFLA